MNKIFDKLDNLAEQVQPDFAKTCKSNGVRAGQVLFGVFSLIALITVWIKGYDIIVAMMTTIYPMWMSIEALNGNNDIVKQTWLTYWCIIGLFQTIEMFFGFVLNFIPFFSIIRLVFFAALILPQINGSKMVYEKYLGPFLREHKSEIEGFVDKFASGASAVASQAAADAKKAAANVATTENLMKAAAATEKISKELEQPQAEEPKVEAN